MNLARLFWIFQISCWVLIIAFVAKYSPAHSSHFQYKSLYLLLYFALGIGATTLYSYFHTKKYYHSNSLYQNLIFIGVGTILLALLCFILDLVYFGDLYLGQNYKSFYDFFLLYFDNFWLVLPWFLFYHLLHFARLSFRQQKHIVVTENQLRAAELEILKKQLNPHFLFTALNSIKALTLTEPMVARNALIELSELLRLILNLEEQKKIIFEEEYKMSEHYLALEKMRFDERLHYTFDIQDEAKYASVLPMILQTLIENSVKHGIGKIKKGGLIKIKVFTENQQLIIKVANTGEYLPNVDDRKGIGTHNLRRRLELTYGDLATFEVKNISKDMVEATVKLPLEDLTNV